MGCSVDNEQYFIGDTSAKNLGEPHEKKLFSGHDLFSHGHSRLH
jgi:hypothetical protein